MVRPSDPVTLFYPTSETDDYHRSLFFVIFICLICLLKICFAYVVELTIK